ncbi:hypothetical protein BLA29_010897, partial [Euroglyphus maynei]
MKRLNDQFHQIALSCRKRIGQLIFSEKPLKPLLNRTIHIFDWLYQQHGYACIERIFTYQELWSNALFGYLILSIPFNVAAVSGLMVKKLTWEDKIIQYLIIVIHTGMTIVSLLQLSQQTVSYHRAKLYLVPIIQSIQIISRPPNNSDCILTKTLRLKLKYDDLFNRLTNGRNYGPYVSTIGVITHRF